MDALDADDAGDVTRLLLEVRDGSPAAFDRLMPLVYHDLRKVAHKQLLRERKTALETTALVHELYLKLVDQADIDWEGRSHFYGIAARAMRQILVDFARKRQTQKRGGGWRRTTLTNRHLGVEVNLDELLALDEALARLGKADERQRQVVEMRFFGGMTVDEIAAVLGVSARMIHRDWIKARAWLYSELYPEEN
jgi:RNA polymerase sigma factor (TIGR02999 family)